MKTKPKKTLIRSMLFLLALGAGSLFVMNRTNLFKADVGTYTVTASVLNTTLGRPNGKISPPGNQHVQAGTGVTFSITPDFCYRFSDVLVDGVSVGTGSIPTLSWTGGTYTLANITSDHTVAAAFATITPPVPPSPAGTGPHNLVLGLSCLGKDPTVPLNSPGGYTLSPTGIYNYLWGMGIYNYLQGTGLSTEITPPPSTPPSTTANWYNPFYSTIKFDLGTDQAINQVDVLIYAMKSFGYEVSPNPTGLHDAYVLVSQDDVTYRYVKDLMEDNAQPAGPYDAGHGWNIVNNRSGTIAYKLFTLSGLNLNTHGRFVKIIIHPEGWFLNVGQVRIFDGGTNNDYAGMEYPEVSEAGTLTRLGWIARMHADISNLRAQAAAAGIDASRLDQLKTRVDEFTDPSNELDSFETTYPHEPLNGGSGESIGKIEHELLAFNSSILQGQGQGGVVLWQTNRWDPITQYTAPAGGNVQPAVRLYMMNGERRSEAINLTNAGTSDATVNLAVNLNNEINPGWVKLYRVQPTDTTFHYLISDMLMPIDLQEGGYSITVPAGMTQQLWLRFAPSSLPAGDTTGNISLTGGLNASVPVTLSIASMPFPSTFSLSMGTYDFTDKFFFGTTRVSSYDINRDNLSAFRSLVNEYKINDLWAMNYQAAYVLSSDFDGNTFDPDKRNYFKPFDDWAAYFGSPTSFSIYVNAARDTSTSIAKFAGTEIHTTDAEGKEVINPDFAAKVQSWVDAWEKHLMDKGMDPSSVRFNIVDEPTAKNQQKTIVYWGQAMRDKKIQTLENPNFTGNGENNYYFGGDDIFSVSKILAPNLYYLLWFNNPGHNLNFYSDLQQQGKKTLGFYNSVMNIWDPYVYPILFDWVAWKYGAKLENFYSFAQGPGTGTLNEYPAKGRNYSPLYFSGSNIYTSKHLEATYEGREDYEYMAMLASAATVLKRLDPGNPLIAESVAISETATQNVTSEFLNSGTNLNVFVDWLSNKDPSVADTQRLNIWEEIVRINEAIGAFRSFDFGLSGSPVQSGYVPVIPSTIYTPALGYGWLTKVDGRDRGPLSGTTESALLQDMNFGTTSPGTFELDGLTPGSSYDVTVTLGDSYAANATVTVPSDFGTVVSGAENLTDVSTAARQYVHRTFTVTPNDTGQLQLQFSTAQANPFWAVNAISVDRQ